ncbi:MAG: hypothetical protein VYA67_11480 [Actinomycetota bacterium]|uniref:Uncharacterized protein n=1 Tax=Mycobacterium lentiflavum TaxID=141349 RepID=A0ABY3UP58_MYCLN|nr:hypothetical protein [Mycobacterium lentiflavum]MEE3064564.1 hypothetical protein [Actinomycetota bacterium]ULP40243.1 hypothetical protein MJO58_14515 [Mycobacterium lentiflavum]
MHCPETGVGAGYGDRQWLSGVLREAGGPAPGRPGDGTGVYWLPFTWTPS